MEEDPFHDHKFVNPETQIKTAADMAAWMKSQAYNDYIGFITTLNQSVKGKSLLTTCTVSNTVQAIVDLLEQLSTWIDEIPPLEQAQRFGNKAYRIWHQKLKNSSSTLVKDILPSNLHLASEEISDYLNESFGNQTRIDYGTGHEASFAAFLCCLYKVRVFKPEDHIAIVNKIFNQYVILSRKLQITYRMEPAGSQGVWGLDDFQFLPFIFGSSQLISNEQIHPRDFVEKTILSRFSKDYIFLQCINHIHEVKTGPFAEHSHTLWGISAVPHWTKVNTGLLKMYKAEVLQKFPVMQHFRFGSILSFSVCK